VSTKPKLPFLFVNVAITADGRIAPPSRHFVPFSSKRDQQLLMELRTKADAVMAGARTVDMGKVDLGPGAPKYRQMRLKNGLAEYNLRVIVSGSASLNPKAHIFTKRFSPIVVLASNKAPRERVEALRQVADDVHLSGEAGVDFGEALQYLRSKWGVKKLLCEGGGEVNSQLFRQKLVDELYLTICPVIFGGRDAPTLADGEGVEHLSEATQLRLKRMERIGDELFCVFAIKK
jgi:2,5-diamino-6-(ribosylamino)-4(3H)-pyrimidinone 5'-phosphate reductase